MTDTETTNLWNDYISTAQHTRKPVKLNRVLKQRMQSFIKARELQLLQGKR